MSDAAPDYRTVTEPRLRVVIPLIVGCAFFMEGLDATMIAVSIPAMADSLHESPLRLNLVITSYLLSLAVFIPVSGWIADRLGARRVFCAAVLIFAGGSALCGLATNLPMLIAMRIVQGFGGAMMTPVGRLILLRSFPRAGLVSAMNWMTIPAMIGPMVGPIVGGVLTSYASWRWIFYLNIPIGLLGGVLAAWLFENFRAPAPARFDLTGFAVAGLGLFLLEFAIENLGRPIVAPAAGTVFFPLAVALLIAYGRHARRSPSPVLDLTLLKIKTFNIGTVTGGICRMGLDATPFMLPLLFQVGFGLSPVQAGLLSFSSTLGAMFVRTFSRLLLRYLGFRRTLVGGALLSAAVTASYALPGCRHAGLGHRRGGAGFRLHPQHPVSGAEHDQLRRRAAGDAEPQHQRRGRRAAIGARLRRRDRRGAVGDGGRLRAGHHRGFPNRLSADRADPAVLRLRLPAPQPR